MEEEPLQEDRPNWRVSLAIGFFAPLLAAVFTVMMDSSVDFFEEGALYEEEITLEGIAGEQDWSGTYETIPLEGDDWGMTVYKNGEFFVSMDSDGYGESPSGASLEIDPEENTWRLVLQGPLNANTTFELLWEVDQDTSDIGFKEISGIFLMGIGWVGVVCLLAYSLWTRNTFMNWGFFGFIVFYMIIYPAIGLAFGFCHQGFPTVTCDFP